MYDGNKIIHRSTVSPGYFRFPFMQRNDLIINNIWTSPEYRGKKLAPFAIRKIAELFRLPGRVFWYVVNEDNRSSIKVAEEAGFLRLGEGIRQRRTGVQMFAKYVLLKTY
jgi:RimJ/RimL family protein N-acetyltransferase